VRTYHDFADLSPTGTLGDPALATPEAGSAFFDVSAGELATFIDDFRSWAMPEGKR
jgi:creatinine amidohydrolase/Fe(II)-dependent formamide hydrolase-like protein